MNVVPGCPGRDGLERRYQAVEPGVLGVMERPVGAGQQFLEALVALVNRIEERHGVGGVDGDRDAEPARGVPQRVQPRVIGQDHPAVGVPDTQAEVLPHLQAAGARRHRPFEALGQPRLRVRLPQQVPVDMAEGGEPAGVAPVVPVEVCFQLIAPPAVEVDHGGDVA